jgi:type I restriction-modification system DNA methylase subunit
LRTEFETFLALTGRLSSEEINRSENDLSSRLSRALEALGLHTVVDTGGGANRRPRPDILCYVELSDADLVVAADALVESKKPAELMGFSSLSDALVSAEIWQEKFVPYVRSHAARILYFTLTDFRRFLVVPISNNLRAAVAAEVIEDEASLKTAVRAASTEFQLRAGEEGRTWWNWCESHLAPSALHPPPITAITNLRPLSNARDLEGFAADLTDVVVGIEGGPIGASLVGSIEQAGTRLDELPDDIRRALMIYTMAQHSGMSIEVAEPFLRHHFENELRTFVAASIHSLVGRLFAFKTIEDCFCITVEPPLVERDKWVFHTAAYDHIPVEELPAAVFRAMEQLTRAANPAVRDLAATHSFYDWIAARVDPAAFRRLFSAFAVHDLKNLDGDLLGRFFELYAQRIDRRRRKEFGQYYTPHPIVAFMWRAVLEHIYRRDLLDQLMVLDPGVGSGTFLIEAARRLQGAGIAHFWARLVGFDIDPQAIAVCYVNVYLTVLGLLDRPQADSVQNLQLYPTDGLDPANGGRLRAILPLLAGEDLHNFLRRRIELSEQIKRRNRFDVVIGNPPYRNNSNRTLAQVAAIFPRLLVSSNANARAQARNIRDDYAWYFAAADYYITENGMIAYIVSDSFCVSSSYKWFREDIVKLYQIHHLIHLGTFVFRDVGPRTSFIIIILEKRHSPLSDAEHVEALTYVDLRHLAQGNTETIGTPDDPRLVYLNELASVQGPFILPTGVEHTPSRDRAFALLPATEMVRRAEASGLPVHAKTGSRIFLRKWPGVITAFDTLFKSDDEASIQDRMQTFFEICNEPSSNRFEQRLDEFATRLGRLEADEVERLGLLASTARAGRFTYASSQVRRAISGSTPNDSCWYPQIDSVCWVYYEPRLAVPRNVYDGRHPGWGMMSQWRDPRSHTIQPKLIYTTARHADRGFKAFVVDEPWLCKLHGGTRQQFHYTGLNNPMKQERLDGLPNNLGEEALLLYRRIAATRAGPFFSISLESIIHRSRRITFSKVAGM